MAFNQEILLNYEAGSGKLCAVRGVKSWAILEGETSCLRS